MAGPVERIRGIPVGPTLDATVHAAVFGQGGAATPEYSTTMACAWLIVEELRKHSDGHFTLLAFTTEWRAGWLTPDDADAWDGGFRRFIAAPTAPEAICRAALIYLAMPGRGGRT